MKNKAFLQIIIAGVLWGTSGIFVHLLSPYGFSSLQMTFLRAAVSTLSMGVYILLRDRKLFAIRPRDLLLCICSGLGLFGTASCYYIAMQATSISTAVMLMYVAPVYVMLFSVLFLGERFSRLKGISVVCMLLGCCLVSGVAGGLTFDLWGIGMGVLSGVAYGAYNIFTKLEMRTGCNPVTATFYTFLFMMCFALLTSQPQLLPAIFAQAPLETVPLGIALGVCTGIIPYFLYTLAMKVLPAGTASALSIVEPMAATVFSVVLFHEKLDLFSGCGIALVLLAVYLLSKTESGKEQTPSANS